MAENTQNTVLKQSYLPLPVGVPKDLIYTVGALKLAILGIDLFYDKGGLQLNATLAADFEGLSKSVRTRYTQKTASLDDVPFRLVNPSRTLDSDETLYVALSYRWGENSEITAPVSQHRLPVSPILGQGALSEFASPSEGLWYD